MNQNEMPKQVPAIGGTSFLIKIQFQQNANWQGTIQWLDGMKTVSFRSTLEMIMLIEEALNKSNTLEEGKYRSWE